MTYINLTESEYRERAIRRRLIITRLVCVAWAVVLVVVVVDVACWIRGMK